MISSTKNLQARSVEPKRSPDHTPDESFSYGQSRRFAVARRDRAASDAAHGRRFSRSPAKRRTR